MTCRSPCARSGAPTAPPSQMCSASDRARPARAHGRLSAAGPRALAERVRRARAPSRARAAGYNNEATPHVTDPQTLAEWGRDFNYTQAYPRPFWDEVRAPRPPVKPPRGRAAEAGALSHRDVFAKVAGCARVGGGSFVLARERGTVGVWLRVV